MTKINFFNSIDVDSCNKMEIFKNNKMHIKLSIVIANTFTKFIIYFLSTLLLSFYNVIFYEHI